MRTLYVDAFAGAAGDMLLGALFDLGFDPAQLKPILALLDLPESALEAFEEQRGALKCRRVIVRLGDLEQPHRRLSDLLALLDKLPDESARDSAKRVFQKLAEAEAKVHGIDVSEVHFHEVGAADSFVDIVGVCIGIQKLGIERVVCSPLPTGSGFVECAHGTLPIPAPATLELIAGIPSFQGAFDSEVLTPTAAALLSTLASEFGGRPPGVIEAVGYGAGSRVAEEGPPNALRLVIINDASAGREKKPTVMIEANIDDMNPQFYPGFIDKLLATGALDVTLHPCVMKKGRPGIVVRAVAGADRLDDVADVFFTESTTIGVRHWNLGRIVGERRLAKVKTNYGAINVKISRHKGKIVNAQPEYRDCESAAKIFNVPVKQVAQEALAAWYGKSFGE
jgi:pyridinium-3,5-bisthiocarboxylic acid mononucleotide nickel chelatase